MSAWMRRFLVLFLALFLLACGTDEDSTDDGNEDSEETTDESAESEPANLAVGSGSGDSFQASRMEVDANQLSAGGSTRLAFNIVDTDSGNELYSGDPVTVTFSSPCLSSSDPRAELDGPLSVETSSGDVSVRYTADGCQGEDSVKAVVSEPEGGDSDFNFSTNEATAILEIAPPEDLSISSSTPEPESLAPRNVQSDVRGSVSSVNFTVLGEGGSEVPDQAVNFELQFEGQNAIGDGAPKLEESTQTTTGSGEVTARVQAGTGNTIVRVVATLASDSSISTASPPIAVNRTIPTQEAFSISVSNALPNAWDQDGATSEITVRAADNWQNNSGNAIVNFVTSGGAIEGDCVLNDDGECTVTWRSQNPRPSDARVSIMARTVGEESFTDEDGDGQFSQGEPFVEALGEAYLDSDQSGDFSPGDVLFDEDGNGNWDAADGEYDGGACPSGANYCSRQPVTVWNDVTGFWMASDDLDMNLTNQGGNEYCAEVWGQADGNRTPPPSDTSIAFEFDGDGEITSSVTEKTVSGDPRSEDSVEVCVNAVGPGTLTAVAEPSGEAQPIEESVGI